MSEDEVLRYVKLDSEELRRIVAQENPPRAALRAASVLEFMEAYHLSDRKNALKQFGVLRRAQALLLGLEGEEYETFTDGFPEETE